MQVHRKEPPAHIDTKHRAGPEREFLSRKRPIARTLRAFGEWWRGDCGHSDYRSSFSSRVPNAEERDQIPDAGNLFRPGDNVRQTAMHNSKSPCRTLHMLLPI